MAVLAEKTALKVKFRFANAFYQIIFQLEDFIDWKR